MRISNVDEFIDFAEREKDSGFKIRVLRNFVLQVERETDPKKINLALAKPSRMTGDMGWDALIAGTVHHVALNRVKFRTDVPEWVYDYRYCDGELFDPLNALKKPRGLRHYSRTPFTLLERNVILSTGELQGA